MPYMVSEEKIEEILNHIDIVDVIGEYLSLKNTGNNHTALCPFHKEKTPSFTVSQDKQIFHCFGCGESGDAIGFIMKYKSYDFLDAVEYLADKSGIQIDKSNQKKDQYRQKYYDINKNAAKNYFSNIVNNRDAQAYLFKRNIDKDAIKKFGLGYSKDSWDDTTNVLLKNGYEIKDLVISGLTVENKNIKSYYDRFRNRIMFPIFDSNNRIIGFGGRVLNDDLPKYLNSPETILFSKGKQLYNLNNAKNSVSGRYIILAEGYMDVIKLSINGFENSVASLGTALTEDQVKLMKKYVKKIVIAYDSDTAGFDAALKAANIIKKNEIDCEILVFQDNMDPDEFLDKYGKEKLGLLIEKAMSYIDFLDFYYRRKFDIKSDSGKLEYIREINRNLRNLRDDIERELAFDKLSKIINVSKESIIKEYNKKNIVKNPFEKETSKDSKLDCIKNDFENELLNLLENSEKASMHMKNKYLLEDFRNLVVYEELKMLLDKKDNFFHEKFEKIKHIRNIEEYLERLIDRVFLVHVEQNRKIIRQRLKANPDNKELKLELIRMDMEIKSLKERSHING